MIINECHFLFEESLFCLFADADLSQIIIIIILLLACLYNWEKRGSVVGCLLMVLWAVRSISYGGIIEVVVVFSSKCPTTGVTKAVVHNILSVDDVYKISIAAYRKD